MAKLQEIAGNQKKNSIILASWKKYNIQLYRFKSHEYEIKKEPIHLPLPRSGVH
jgi:hypothetical protein